MRAPSRYLHHQLGPVHFLQGGDYVTRNSFGHNVEPVRVVGKRVEQAYGLFGRERVQLMPVCLFATFLYNPVASARTTDARLRAIVQARDLARG